jgi:hypothetical protein
VSERASAWLGRITTKPWLAPVTREGLVVVLGRRGAVRPDDDREGSVAGGVGDADPEVLAAPLVAEVDPLDRPHLVRSGGAPVETARHRGEDQQGGEGGADRGRGHGILHDGGFISLHATRGEGNTFREKGTGALSRRGDETRPSFRSRSFPEATRGARLGQGERTGDPGCLDPSLRTLRSRTSPGTDSGSLVDDQELFLPFEKFPWFLDAPVGAILELERPAPGHLRWPRLDVDLTLDSIEHPERFPLVADRGTDSGD